MRNDEVRFWPGSGPPCTAGRGDQVVLLIFGGICNVLGLALVLGAGHFRMRERLHRLRRDDKEPEIDGSWSVGFGGFLIIIGSALLTVEYVNRFG